jgi:NhaP-type Na+/H+ or K+/H+ antiporter
VNHGEPQIDTVTIWYLIIGALLILMGLSGSVLKRLPLSPAMLYLAIGFALGPSGIALVTLDPYHDAHWLTQLTEVALLISLFSVGLRLRVAINDPMWQLPVRLGVLGMLATIALLACANFFLVGLSLGGAVLLAAMLAPTDPVLASDVQIQDVGDRDRIRFSLSGEGGLNDGTTFPFVMLGLYLLGAPGTEIYGGRWAVPVMLWGVAGGLLSGWLLGRGVVALALYLRRRYRQALGMEEFFTLGLIALSYGIAHLIHGIGFVAVFAAGVAMRDIEHRSSGEAKPKSILGAVPLDAEATVAAHPSKGAAYMAETVLGFNQQLEHIAEFVMVLLLGIMLSAVGFSFEGVLIAALLLVVIRPAAAAIALAGQRATRMQRWLVAWFGIRGIGSFYYLVFALQYPWQDDLKQRLVPLVLTVLAVSVLVHGVTATPLMEHYYRLRRRS